jgi:hypothetical protein
MWDVVIAIGLGLCSFYVAYLGIHLTMHPATDAEKGNYKAQFTLIGLASLMLIGVQAYRAVSSSDDLKDALKKQGKDIEAIKDDNKRPIQVNIPPIKIPSPAAQKPERHTEADKRAELKSEAVQLSAEIISFMSDRQKSGLGYMRGEIILPQSGDAPGAWETRWKNEEKRVADFRAETLSLYQRSFEKRAVDLLVSMKVNGINVDRAYYKPNSDGSIQQFAIDLAAVSRDIR